jgi:hypothetical protein
MPSVGFERTIPVSARAKTVHALDRAATVTGGLITIRKTKTKWNLYVNEITSEWILKQEVHRVTTALQNVDIISSFLCLTNEILLWTFLFLDDISESILSYDLVTPEYICDFSSLEIINWHLN